MKYHPILFQTAMVQALIAGTKTQTRRLVKEAPSTNFDPQDCDNVRPTRQRIGERKAFVFCTEHDEYVGEIQHRYTPGDRLWVREAWADYNKGVSADMVANYPEMGKPHYIYRADFTELLTDKAGIWKPSIHMPRAASRLTLEVVTVSVERLQEISEQDALAEGIARRADEFSGGGLYKLYSEAGGVGTARASYASLWDYINGADSWKANPWVWVISFRVVGEIANA